MANLNISDLEKLEEFVKFKKEEPEKYKQLLIDIKEIMLDLMKVAKEISEEIEE